MTQATAEKFSCASCGRTFRWKPEIAGKKGKCSCGALLVAPVSLAIPAASAPVPKPKVAVQTTLVPKVVSKTVPVVKAAPRPAPSKPAAPPAPPSPSEPEPQPESDPTYDLASLKPDEEAIAIASREAVAPAAALPAVPAAVLDYQHAPKKGRSSREMRVDPHTGELHDPMRNLIVPLVLFAVGCALLGAYIFHGLGIGAMAELVFGVAATVMLVLVLAKTVLMTLVAFPLAAYCDVSLGLLRTAALKFAAVLIFAETLILWIEYLLISSGVISFRTGFSTIWLLYAVMLATIFHICFCYVFRMPASKVRFAMFMAFVTRLFNFFLLIALLAWASSFMGRHAASAGTGPTYQAAQAQGSPTPADNLITARLTAANSPVVDSADWIKTSAATDAAKNLIAQMYDANAEAVFIDGNLMYVTLSDDPDDRQECLDAARKYCRQVGLGDVAVDMSAHYQYLVMPLTPAPSGQTH